MKARLRMVTSEGVHYAGGCGACVDWFRRRAASDKAARGGRAMSRWDGVPWCQRPRGRTSATADCGRNWHKGHRCALLRARLSDEYLTRAEHATLDLFFVASGDSFKSTPIVALADIKGIDLTREILHGLEALDAERNDIRNERREAEESRRRAREAASRVMGGRRIK